MTHDSTALFLVMTYGVGALAIGALITWLLSRWGERKDSFEAELAEIASANVRTIIEARNAGVTADCGAVQVREAA